MHNIHLDAVEHGDTIAFMHQVQQGAASKSFGLQVALLAGVPKSVVSSARRKLAVLESHAKAEFTPEQQSLPMLNEPEPLPHPVIDQLQQVNPDNLTAKQALDLIYQLVKVAKCP